MRQLAEPASADDPDASAGAAPWLSKAPPDAAILLSLPGIGTGVLATLLAGGSDAVRRRDYNALRCLCGVAPVTRRSGKSLLVTRRLAAHNRLRDAAYHWAGVAAQHDPVSHAKYQALRARGHGHARALRSVADRLLNLACAMLRDGINPAEPPDRALQRDMFPVCGTLSTNKTGRGAQNGQDQNDPCPR